MSQRQFDRRQFLGAGLVIGAAGTTLGLRAVLAQEGYGDTPEASPGATPGATPRATPGATPAGAAVTVEAGSFFFDPEQFTIPANTPTVIEVTNVSDTEHTFTIEPLEIDVEVHAGETKTVTVDASPGDYTYICTYHPERMTGTLIVE